MESYVSDGHKSGLIDFGLWHLSEIYDFIELLYSNFYKLFKGPGQKLSSNKHVETIILLLYHAQEFHLISEAASRSEVDVEKLLSTMQKGINTCLHGQNYDTAEYIRSVIVLGTLEERSDLVFQY